MDYAIPRADEVPPVIIEKTCTALSAQSARRQGRRRGRLHRDPPAVVNAAVDALAPFGVTHLTCR